MSSIQPEDQFSSEDDLKRLLERWIAPEPSSLLDKRVANSYYREFGRATAAEPVPLPQRKNEVVAMKFCSTCQEEFAEKFSFCPVDGTPLNGFAPKRRESAIRTVEKEPAVLASRGPALAGTKAAYSSRYRKLDVASRQ